ncbi:TonB-dependent receptor [Caulobacter hibisci]|uniref:TonB-dependent receptor n=1 Tax=Caulobacter hibisci TaxID=2035993 RepID=A0ABS0T064_9CAUL|nr:TonB-dependent receptor [Caulobacter hibisci]MBI1684298.1 TonB-dependent receptor [Caulobacter hibisci]
MPGRRPLKAALLAGAGLAMGWSAIAHAQASGQAPVEPAALEEVVVTAQKRSENVQNIPVAVTAVSAETLEKQGAANLQALQGSAPNVEINSSNAATGVAIRGIFSTNDGPQGDPAVAYHIDGVYLGRPQSTGGLVYDIQQIEVLRGPQGTLYGRNATAGAINVISARPRFDFEAALGAEYGSYNQVGVSGMANLPITDKIAARVAMRTLKRDGYAADGKSEDQDSRAFRGQLLVKPTDDLSVLLSADYDLRKGVGPAAYKLNVAGVDPRSTNTVNPGAHIDNRNWGVHSEITWDLGAVTLTVLPAYHEMKLDNLYASDRRIQLNQEAKQHSLEVRLASPGDQTVSWILGAYYWDEEQSSFQTLLAPPTSVRFGYPDIDAFSRALFGQATWHVTDKLRLTGGLRYTADQKKQNGTTEVRNPAGVLLSRIANVANAQWEAVNWKASAEYQLAERSLIYVTAATGYKGGGNYDGLAPNTYEPEKVLSFEAGSKNRLFSNALQLNLTAFHYGYKNYQASQLGCLNLPSNLAACTASGRITYNADKATVYGLELESQWAITSNDRLGVVGALTHSEFNDFVLPVTPYSSGGNFSGNPLPKSPKSTVTVDYSHRFDLPNGGALTAAARARFVSKQYLLFDIRSPIIRQDAYGTGDLNLTYDSPEGMWSVTAFANNVTDELVKAYAFATSTAGVYYGTYLPPRTLGLRVGAKF